MKIHLLIYFILTSLLISCSKKEEEKEIPKTGLAVTAIGAVNYGGVIVGGHKDAAINITNYGPDTEEFNFDSLASPFTVVSKSVTCSAGKLLKDQSCIISVRFQPTAEGTFTKELTSLNPKVNLNLSGVGLVNGYLVLDQTNWNLGNLSAGTLNTKEFTITNLGDLTVKTPDFNLPSYIKVGFNRCGSFIPAKISCKISFEAKLLEARLYDELYTGSSDDGGFVQFRITSSVTPSVPSGLITFANPPSSMNSAGEESIINSNLIKDAYGNVVVNGTIVNVTSNNILLLLDGNNYTVQNGKISFRVRTRTIKGSASISSTANQASGYITFPVTAGSAFGSILVSDVLNEIPANGLSQVVINTNIILDQYSNIIEDGTEVYFELIGDGVVNLGGANPKKLLTYAINGSARAIVRAGTTAQQATLKIYSGPIKDSLNNIVGYSANGEVTLNFVPGPAAGVIPVNSGLSAIYSNTNPPTDLDYLPSKTVITVGPVKDQFNNVVKQNTVINIITDKGFNSSGSIPLTVSQLTTNATGYASFELIGNSQRGNIQLVANSALATGQASVWAYLRTKTKYSNLDSKLQLFFRHSLVDVIPLATAHWAPIPKSEGILNLDGITYGYAKENAAPQTKFALDEGLPYYTWDCFFPARENLIASFCPSPISEGSYAPFLVYDKDHNLRFDIPANNPATEMLGNGHFTGLPDVASNFWKYKVCNETNCSSGTKGPTFSSDLGGVMVIDNAQNVNNCTQENPEDCPKKNNAFSDWISVSHSKKYIITFTVKQQFGQTTSRATEVGVVESEEALPLLNEPENIRDTVLQPRILKTGIINTSGSLVPLNVRVVFTPKTDTKHIRIYLSTQGTGQLAKIVVDDVSLKEISTQNIHDPLVTEGASVAYMPVFDSALIFGGSTVLQGGSAPNFSFNAENSNRTTVLTKLLDLSSSVVVENYNDANPETENLGTVPSPRAHTNLIGIDDLVYSFGGYESGGAGQAKNDSFIFNGATRKWTQHMIAGDPLLLTSPTEGKPIPRYQSGMVHIPELNQVLMAGGIYASDEEDETAWTTVDDIWSFPITNNASELVWKRECNNCGLFGLNLFTNLGLYQYLMESNGTLTAANTYATAAKNIKRTNLIWHQPTQKLYIHIPESNAMVVYDPYTKSVTVPPLLGIKQMSNAFQIVYNPMIGRTYAYVRGNAAIEDSKIFYWDMNIREKQVLKARFKLDTSAKQHLQELKFSIHAYGSSKSVRNYGENVTAGLEMYLYNYATETWLNIGENNAATAGAMTLFLKKIDGIDIKKYVSVEGYVELALVPKGEPGIDGGEALMGNKLEVIDLGLDENEDLIKVKKVVTGLESTCAVLSSNELKCWGRNNFGQLGIAVATAVIGGTPNTMGDYLVTTQLFNPQSPQNADLAINEIYAGSNHMCALFNNNRAKCWGKNAYGQTGFANAQPQAQWVTGGNLNIGDNFGEMGENLAYINVGTEDGTVGTGPAKILKLSLGEDHTCAIIESRQSFSGTIVFYPRVKCWGRKDKGQIGLAGLPASPNYYLLNGNSTPFVTLDASFNDLVNGVNRERDVLKLYSGSNTNCVLLTENYFRCWGDNSYGQFALGNTTNQLVPALTGMGNIQSTSTVLFAMGAYHNCMYTEYQVGAGSNLKCWGKNLNGQLGIGNTNTIGDQVAEVGTNGNNIANVDLGVGLFPVELTLGQNHSCAKLNNGKIKCWGENLNGQLGQGPLVTNVGATAGTMGENLEYVDLGTNSTTGLPLTVKSMQSSVGGFYNCAVTATDDLKCWGINTFGQLGTEDTRNRGRGYDVGTGSNELKIDYMELEEVY